MPVNANAAPDPAWLRAQAAEFDTHAATVRLAAAAAVVSAYQRRAATTEPNEQQEREA